MNVVSQDLCKVVKKYNRDNYQVEINGKKLVTISEDQQKTFLKAKADLEAKNKLIKEKDRLIASLEAVVTQSQDTVKKHKEYISELEKLNKNYKEKARICCKLTAPTFSLSFGAGLNNDLKPGGFLGVGYKQFRLSGAYHKDSQAVYLGYQLNLF
jgi:hypothetical protein